MRITFVNVFDYMLLQGNETEDLPLGILSLSQVINNDKRHSAEVISMNHVYISGEMKASKVFQENIENDARYILNSKPDIVSLYTMCNTYHIALFVAKKIKELNPRIIVILGGPQATIVAEETLKKYDYIDGIGLGEGEANIVGILDAYESEDFTNINGLAYRLENEIIIKNNENLIEDLDSLPMIDISRCNVNIKDKISIDVGRGCPYSCIFCSTKSFWKRKFRIKSANRIYEEILFYKNNYNINKFNFEHDLFVANRNLVIDLCQKIKNSNLKIEWGCSARIDTVDEELLKEMSSAGCNAIFFGVESGSQRMQKELKKNLKIEDIKSTIKAIVKYGIKGVFSFIYGFPEETENDIEQTLNLIKYIYDNYLQEIRSANMNIQLHKLMYLPKTEITLRHKDKLVHVEDYRMEVIGGLDSWNDEELNNMVDDMDIFPNLFYVPTDLLERLKNLDTFMAVINYVGQISFKTSYNYMLSEFNDSILNLYYSFLKEINEEELLNCIKYRGQADGRKDRMFEIERELLKKFVYNYKFKNINVDLLQEVFDFEYERNKLVFGHKVEGKCWLKKYRYNVIDMVNRKKINEKIGNFLVVFKIDNGKYRIKYI